MKIVLSLILCLLLVGCNNNKQLNKPESVEQIIEDTLYKVKCYDLIPPIEVLEKWEDCPDSIITAFTRNGVVEDSVVAYRQGGLIDSLGNYYSPAYVFKAAVGDAWLYDIDGKFVYFYCTPLPHSGKGELYNP